MEILVNNANDAITSYQQAIHYAGQALLAEKLIKPEFIQACIEREQLYPTGLLFDDGQAIAIPHSRAELVNRSSISIVKLAKPVKFGRMEDPTLTVACRLVFNLALNSGDQHITILRKLMKLCQHTEFIEYCYQLENKEAADYIINQLIS